MNANKVRFFFDYNSPYSYFASLQIEKICEKYDAEILWDPIVLGGIFKEDGTKPPHLIPKRAKYLLQDLRNLSEFYEIPYRERTDFIFSPILAMRSTIQIPQGAERAPAVHALYKGVFAEDLDLADPETVRELLNQAGFDGEALVSGSKQQSVKDQLRANTDLAHSLGVFGVPTFFLNEEKMFWGHDRLKTLAYFLQKHEK